MPFRIALATVLLISLHPRATAEGREPLFSQSFQRAAVAADHPLASEAGAEILRQGGNVVDAAVATAFALSVVRPQSCGIGGGGFMVIWDARKQEAVAVDYRERAPAAAHRDMYLKENRHRPGSSVRGGLAVAVPGDVAGLCFALETYGSLELRTVLAPAIRLAREGFVADQTFANATADVLDDLQSRPGDLERFAPLVDQYLPGGKPPAVGDRVSSPLVNVLEAVAEQGRDGFYQGPVARAIVAEVERQGGIMTLEDLASMEPVVRHPLRGTHAGYQVVTMPPASSGGIAILETLNILDAFKREHPQQALARLEHNSPEAVHLITEAMKHAFADRAEYLGDADFAQVPVKRLISEAHATRLAARIEAGRTLARHRYGRFAAVEDGGTSHFSVMDAEGNAVACTETINTFFGSYVMEPTYGIVLNNEMDDFAAVPGEPNAFGLIQSEANAVAPGKKPLSSMSPTILVKDGQAQIAVGGSGGPRIISGTLLTILNLTTFGLSPDEAITSPRFHHQWIPESLFLEDPLFESLEEELEAYGHDPVRRSLLCVVQAAVRTGGKVTAVSDPRKGGLPAGH